MKKMLNQKLRKTKQNKEEEKRISVFPTKKNELHKSLDHSVSLLRVLQYIVIAPLIKC